MEDGEKGGYRSDLWSLNGRERLVLVGGRGTQAWVTQEDPSQAVQEDRSWCPPHASAEPEAARAAVAAAWALNLVSSSVITAWACILDMVSSALKLCWDKMNSTNSCGSKF